MLNRFAALLIASGLALGVRAAAQTREAGTFESQAADARRLVPASGDERSDFAAAEDYFQTGEYEKALAAFRRFLKLHPASTRAAKAQFRIAEILESQGKLSRAFDAFQTLVTKYPDTPEFEQAVARQVLIANQYLDSRRLNLLGLALMPGAERAQTMFESILKNAPYSKHAPVSQFNLGLAFERQGRLPEARRAYQTVLDKYPNSPVADDALYQIGYMAMRQGLSGRSQDLSALVTARETFEDFLLQYPNSEKTAQAKDNLKAIGEREASDLMAIARYYDWSRNYRAAAVYYNDVIRRQPGTADAEKARERVQVLRNDLGEDALRVGAERAESGERAAIRRRLQAQVETSALSDYAGPPRRDLVPDELPVARAPRLRTGVRDLQPLPPVEPALPTQ
ncbi:MAG: outer membrane protein assembly factor BamD [Terrimicrobiaceae bacterium]|nr:outer membrane protein assembly factor BamD [Terrimicrobiaceae bacterium]